MSDSVASSHSIPITLIGGYLGAGKTTLINKILSYPGLPPGTAVLVNDFGDINIDESLIRGASNDGTVIGLSNGCICCTLRDDRPLICFISFDGLSVGGHDAKMCT